MCDYFVTDERKTFKECVKLSWPGDRPEDKMPKCKFPLETSMIMEENPEDLRPKVISSAFQVIECTWVRELDGADRDQPGQLSGYEPVISYTPAFMFDLIILMAPKWKKGVIQFGKWTMTEDMVADVHYGKYSFSEYIREIYAKGLKF